MNLFWQITLIEFLLNVAVFAGAIVFYGPIRGLAARVAWGNASAERLATGMLFGIATAAALLLPVHLEGGAAVGCTTILLVLAGPLEGWIAILGGLAFSVLIEFQPWMAKEQSHRAAIASLLVAAAVGFFFHWALKNRSCTQRQLRDIHLPIVGVLSAAGGLSILAISQGSAAVVSSIVPALLSNIFAAVILGTLLVHEKRRSETEYELRQSEMRLAGQAKELAVARDSAESANHAKSMFLANMSHELRTPLNAILGYAQLLKRDRNLTQWQAEAYNTIQESGEHLLMLIVDILDISKIEAGKLELQLNPVAMTGFLNGIANIVRVQAEEKALDFECDIALDVPVFAWVDQKRLRQVLLNLLSNAVKFTHYGGVTLKVEVATQSRQEVLLHFEVRDTGTGIAEDELDKVFQPFEQVGDEQHRAGGTGLGLSISRRLVRLMGGEIRVVSKLGQGSCFAFDISAQLPIDSERPTSQSGELVIGYEGRRKRILVVDDTDANRSVLVAGLGRLGFDMSQAVNGLDALRCAQASPPDLILMDVRMPVMDGLEAMRQMHQIPNLCIVPIIAVSAGATQDEQDDCVTAGAKGFLTKPIDRTRLLAEVGNLLGLSWVHEIPLLVQASSCDSLEPIKVPKSAQMGSLRELAKAGNMRAIREEVGRIADLDPQFRPFADKITKLALGYQSKSLLRLVERQIAEEHVEKGEQL